MFNHEERRPRVLLAHRNEISQILKKQEQKGARKSALLWLYKEKHTKKKKRQQEQKGGTCVPLRIYFNDIGFLKCEIATCRFRV